MLPPKTSHRAKFHQDWSNQLGDRGCQLGLGQKKLFCHGQKRDYVSRDSQCARGATNKLFSSSCRLHYKGLKYLKNIRILQSGILFQTQNSANFAAFSL